MPLRVPDVLPGLLVGVRVLALLFSAPVFGDRVVPVRVRVGLAIAIALAITPALPPPALTSEASPWHLGLAVFGEGLVGLTLGLAARMVFSAVGIFGQVVSVQSGLGAAAVLDPTTGERSLAVATLFQTFAILVYLAIDGHHSLLRALAISFEQFPLAGGGPSPAAFAALASLGAAMFEIGVRLALPITVAMLVTNVALGILGRSMVQMNLMTVQLPAQILLTLVLLLLGAAPLRDALAAALSGWNERVVGVLVGGF